MFRLLRHSAFGAPLTICSFSFRHQTSAPPSAPSETVSPEKVWALWNEGNLFSLSLTQLQSFLARSGVRTDSSAKKAAVVRQVEEYLHAKDATSRGEQTQQQQQQQQSGYGRWSQSAVMQPETLLDLAQAGFYEGSANMAPKAFQLLVSDTSADVVVSRVNTTAFPGFPANTECYTLCASEKDVALRARYSKVLQWCSLNMANLQMDGELHVDLGKLLLQPSVVRKGRAIVSAYTLQQRLQLSHPYTWVSAVPDAAAAALRAHLTSEGFAPLGRSPEVGYAAKIQRATDALALELDERGTVRSVHAAWVHVQSAWCTKARGPDVRLLLRSRPPLRREEVETYAALRVIALADDDVTDVLPPERGQLVYLSENETRRLEKVTERGVKLTVREVRRQPLIVLRDAEEDQRTEWSISVELPANAGKGTDVRAIGLAVFELAGTLATLATEEFVKEFGCEAKL